MSGSNGRPRSPEYVKTVTGAYREAVDAVRDGTYSKEMVESLLTKMKEVYNRGHSSGYYLGSEQGWSGVYGSKATSQKRLAGKISPYYPRSGVVKIVTNGKVSVGDSFVVIGQTTGIVDGVIEEIRVDELTVEGAKSEDVFSIKVSERVRRNDKLFVMDSVEATH